MFYFLIIDHFLDLKIRRQQIMGRKVLFYMLYGDKGRLKDEKGVMVGRILSW